MKKPTLKKQIQVVLFILATSMPITQANAAFFGLAAVPALGALVEVVSFVKKGLDFIGNKLSSKKTKGQKAEETPKAKAKPKVALKKPDEAPTTDASKLFEAWFKSLEVQGIELSKQIEERNIQKEKIHQLYVQMYQKYLDEKLKAGKLVEPISPFGTSSQIE